MAGVEEVSKKDFVGIWQTGVVVKDNCGFSRFCIPIGDESVGMWL